MSGVTQHSVNSCMMRLQARERHPLGHVSVTAPASVHMTVFDNKMYWDAPVVRGF